MSLKYAESVTPEAGEAGAATRANPGRTNRLKFPITHNRLVALLVALSQRAPLSVVEGYTHQKCHALMLAMVRHSCISL